MKIILLCIFTFIFYTLLTELAPEDNTVSVGGKGVVENVNIAPKETRRVVASSPEKNTIKQNSIIDEAVIDEALNFDKAEAVGEVQNSLEQALLEAMADRQLSVEEAKQYKKHFIREYLKKAKQAGYDVVLNDQLQVISVKPRKTYEPIFIEDE